MTDYILKHINNVKQLSLLSDSYLKGMIKLNISKLAKNLKVDRKTVRRYLNGITPKKTKSRKKYMDSYKHQLINVLNDKYQSFDYKDHLYKYFKREFNITCSRSTFCRYIDNNSELSKKFKHKKDNSFTERFETDPGQQIQFDMKENLKLIDINGHEIIVNIATITLGYSRYNMRKLIINKDTDTLISFLAECFETIGGSPKEIVIDNLKQFVTKPRYKNNPAIFNNKFEQFCKDYNVSIKACMTARPQTKGKTETQNKIVDQMKNYNGKYRDIEHIHEILKIINDEDNNSISQATNLVRIFLLEKEKGKFQTLPSKELRKKYYLTLKEVIVSNESLITYKSRKYSVPKNYIGLKVGLSVIDNKLQIYYNNKIITIHKITNNLLNIKSEHQLNYFKNMINDNQLIDTNIIKEELRNIKYD